MIGATSASERLSAAREALDRLDRMPLRHEVVPIDEPVRRHAYLVGYEAAVREMRAELDTLRALVTPAETNESPAQIAQRLMAELAEREPLLAAYIGRRSGVVRSVKALTIEAAIAGIQAAWQSWEPDDYAHEYGD